MSRNSFSSRSTAASEKNDEARERNRLERIESELYYSIETDDPDRLARLLASTAESADSPGGFGLVDPNTSFSGIDPLGKSLFWCPLHFCCEKGRRQCAQLLLSAGANRDIGDRWCMTPLMYAVQTEWFDMANMMIDAGATVDWQDTRGRTPLSLAVDCSDDTAVRLLCQAGADVNVQDLVGRSPVWLSVSKDGRVPHLKALLDTKQCELNCADLREKRTALQAAIVYAQNDRCQYVKMLIAAGSEVNHRDEANYNSLLNLLTRSSKRGGRRISSSEDSAIIADTEEEELKIARMLINAGYQLNDVPHRSNWYKFGGTAIKMAAENGFADIVRLMLDHGADPDIPDDCGVTPLLSAAVNNHLSICCALISANCQIENVGEMKFGGVQRRMTALQGAILSGHYDVARLLVYAGASTASEKYLFDSSATIPQHLLEEDGLGFWMWLTEWATNTASLSELCIRSLRASIRRPIQSKLSRLPLPNFVRHCVMLDHVMAEFIDIP